tara:strand:- start:173 stop:343 length:171 start_codon:yes stop_codon:yes gene_type:complete
MTQGATEIRQKILDMIDFYKEIGNEQEILDFGVQALQAQALASIAESLAVIATKEN